MSGWGDSHTLTDTVLTNRLLASVPAATFELETLVRLAGIRATTTIATAAVECVHRPHLLINPQFVARHCARDEHLFLLVMHEMWHIILAHTSLYPRSTMAHNIAFDAVINAGLMRQFHRPEYRGFFESVNPADQFPACLLRPPEGWPSSPVYPDESIGPPGTRRIIEQLYPPRVSARWSPPLYQEILDLLEKWIDEKRAQGEAVETPVLIGDHEGEDGQGADGKAYSDPIVGPAARRIAEKMPFGPASGLKRGDGADLAAAHSDLMAASEAARRAFAEVLRRALVPQKGGDVRRARVPVESMSGTHVLPNGRDRLAPAREALDVQGVLWSQPNAVKVRAPDKPSMAHIYLDVSGSMNRLLPALLMLLVPYVVRRQAAVYQFSTRVEPLALPALRAGSLKTTFGTQIECVLTHALEARERVPLTRILVLTDGMTGTPPPPLMAKMRAARIDLIAVISGESGFTAHLKDAAAHTIVLPPLGV